MFCFMSRMSLVTFQLAPLVREINDWGFSLRPRECIQSDATPNPEPGFGFLPPGSIATLYYTEVETRTE